MSWKIEKTNAFIYMVVDSGMNKGIVTCIPAIKDNEVPKFKVEMLMVEALNKTFNSCDEAFAYIRGIEATVNVYGKETNRKR